MARKRSWFNLVKRFFISEKESKQDKGSRRRWVFWGKLRIKSRPPSIAAPSPPRERRKNSNESKEEQSRHALDVALASAAAAEAAVAAAHIAAEVVWLANAPQSTHGCDKDTGGENSSIKAHFTHQDERHIVVLQSAAIRIQTAYRSYLARKALRALKGIVKLQAIIRGRNVRRQAMNTLKCLQSIVSIQSQVCAKRIQMVEATAWPCDDEPKQFQTIRDKIIKMDTNSQRRWDGSILTKDEADAMFLSKKEAAMKRERIKEYSFTHRNSAETERSKVNGRLKQWLEQWVENQVGKSKEVEDLDSVLTSNPNPRLEHKGKHLKLRGSPRQNQVEGLDTSPISAPRRSFHKKQCSLGDDSSFSGTSPVMVPTYMAATESAKAKARSMSSPKLRPCGGYDAYSDSYSPCKNKLGVFSTANPETPGSAKFGRPNSLYQQRSPSLKGLLPGPVKSSRTLQDLSFDSECSFKTWNPQSNTSFR